MLGRRRDAFLVVAGHVAAREDAVLELFEGRIQLPDAVLEIVQILEQHPVRLDEGGYFICTAIVSHQLVVG